MPFLFYIYIRVILTFRFFFSCVCERVGGGEERWRRAAVTQDVVAEPARNKYHEPYTKSVGGNKKQESSNNIPSTKDWIATTNI